MPPDLLPFQLIILGCIFAALGIGIRIGIFFARKTDEGAALKHAILSEEYTVLYEDMSNADQMLHDIYTAIRESDKDKIVQFLKDYQVWTGENDNA